MAAVDSLEVIIETKAQDTAKSLNNLVKQLGLIAEGINAIGSNTGLNEFAKKAQEATKNFANIQNAAKGLSNSITPEIQKVSKSFDEIAAKYKDLGKGFKFVGSTSAIQKQIDSYTNSLERAKLKKEELEAGGKTGGQGYEDAIKDIQKFENILASLKNQLAEMQTGKISFDTSGIENVENLIERMKEQIRQSMEGVRIENPIDLTSLSKEDFSTFMRLKSEMERAGMAAEQMGGQIREAVNIPVSAFNFNSNAMAATFGEAARNIENMSQAAQVFGENAGQALNDLPNPEIRINGIEEAGNRLREFGERLNQLVVPEIREDNLDKLQSSLSKTESKLEELRTKLENGLTMGHITESVDGSGFVRLQEQIAYTEKQAEALRNRIAEVGNSGGAGGIERFQAALSKLSAVGKTAISALSGVASAIKKMGSIIGTAISKVAGLGKSFLGLGKSSKSTSVSLAGGFKTILKYTLGIRSLYVLVGKLRRAMKEAFSNLAQYSSETNASLSMLTSSLGALKNSLAVAFAPIVNMIAPYISVFIDMLTRAFNAVGRFFAALTGKSFAVQAVKNFKDYAAGVSKAGGAAKKAGKDAQQGTRAFDELKTISINKDEGGGGGGGEVSPSDMFMTVPIEGAMKEFADKVRGILGGIFDVFEQAWESKGKSVIDSAKSALSSLGTSALSVGKTFYDVFTNGTGLAWLESSLELLRSMFDVIESISTAFSTAWNSGAGFENVTALFTMFTNINGLLTSIGDSFSRVFSNGTGAAIWTNILGIITGVYNIIGNLAKSIQTAWDTAGLGDSIWQGILNIVNIILGTLHNIADSTAEWAAQLDFTPLLTSVGTFLKAIEPLAANIGAGLEWFWNNVLLPISTWAIQDAVPAFLDMVSAAIGSLNAIIEVFKPIGEWLWNEFLLPIGEWTGGVIIDTMNMITAGLETFSGVLTNCQIVSDAVSGSLDILSSAMNVITETVLPSLSAAWDRLIEILTPLGEFLSTVLADAWNNIITPALQFLGDTVLPKVTETFENLWNNVLVPLGSFLGDVLEPVIKIVSDVLTSLWQNVVVPLANAIGNVLGKAFNGICEIFNKTVIPIVNSVIKVFQFLWKNVFSPIISFLNTTLKPVFSSVFKSIGKIVDDLSKTFGGLIDFITGVFTGNWSKAWNGIKDIFSGIWNALKDVVKTPVNAIIGFINGLVSGVVSGINGMINALNKVSFNIPDWVPALGGKTFGFNLSTITAPQIPYLAKGAVFKGGNPFLAVVNDQKRGQTNVETPLKVIQEALREELSKFSVNVRAAVPNTRALNYSLQPAPVPSYVGAYGNYQYDTSAYTGSYNNNNSDMSNAIEMAVYKATCNAVSSALNNNKTMKDMLEEIKSGHTIEMDGREVAETVRKRANEYMRVQGKPYFMF